MLLLGIILKDHGSFKNAFAYLHYLKNRKYLAIIENYAQQGVEALRANTPKDSGLTANSWTYRIEHGLRTTDIVWENSNVTKTGQCIAIMLQYGHGTGTGGYVRGQDYINPALRPVFDDIISGIEQAVKSL